MYLELGRKTTELETEAWRGEATQPVYGTGPQPAPDSLSASLHCPWLLQMVVQAFLWTTPAGDQEQEGD